MIIRCIRTKTEPNPTKPNRFGSDWNIRTNTSLPSDTNYICAYDGYVIESSAWILFVYLTLDKHHLHVLFMFYLFCSGGKGSWIRFIFIFCPVFFPLVLFWFEKNLRSLAKTDKIWTAFFGEMEGGSWEVKIVFFFKKKIT